MAVVLGLSPTKKTVSLGVMSVTGHPMANLQGHVPVKQIATGVVCPLNAQVVLQLQLY